jgi:UrcA family protein
MSTNTLRDGAVLCIASLLTATTAAAQKARIEVGDLSTPAGATSFDHRLNDGARRFCAERYRPMELNAIATCEQAVREEALAELSPAQREAYAQARRPAQRLAAAGS